MKRGDRRNIPLWWVLPENRIGKVANAESDARDKFTTNGEKKDDGANYVAVAGGNRPISIRAFPSKSGVRCCYRPPEDV